MFFWPICFTEFNLSFTISSTDCCDVWSCVCATLERPLCACLVISVCVSTAKDGSSVVWLAALRLPLILLKGKARQKSYDFSPSLTLAVREVIRRLQSHTREHILKNYLIYHKNAQTHACTLDCSHHESQRNTINGFFIPQLVCVYVCVHRRERACEHLRHNILRDRRGKAPFTSRYDFPYSAARGQEAIKFNVTPAGWATDAFYGGVSLPEFLTSVTASEEGTLSDSLRQKAPIELKEQVL